MRKVQLAAAFVANAGNQSTMENEKRAMLCYEGHFVTAAKGEDGKNIEVDITGEVLRSIADNHNARLAALGSEPRMADYPPIQLDHSASAMDTVGRLVGPLEVGEYDGKVALFGRVRILGAENWARVEDGRWTHLSIGADLDNGFLYELSITPFPAAPDATLLSAKGAAMDPKEEAMLKHLCNVKKMSDEEARVHLAALDDEGKKCLCDEMAKLGDEVITIKHDADGDGNVPGVQKEELSAEEDEGEKEDEEEEDKEKGKTELAGAFRSFNENAGKLRVAMRRATLANQFAKLRAQGKVTPAELKKVNLAELAGANEATIKAVMATYENREPVIRTAQLGTVKALDTSDLKAVRLKALEDETRANMSLLKGKAKKKTNLSMEDTNVIAPDRKPVEEVSGPGDHEALWGEIVKTLATGDEAGAKALYARACRMDSGAAPVDETEMSALMGAFADLESNFGKVVQLAGAHMGVKL